MSDLTPGGAGLPDPGLPAPDVPDGMAPDLPDSPAIGGDETVRVPAQPEVAWTAPVPAEAPRALPWEAAGAAAAGTAAAGAAAAGPNPAPDAPPAGVLSAATVGWIAPPPEPIATGKPGWIIASTGIRFVAYLIDGFICALILGVGVGIALAISPGLARGGTPVAVAYGLAAAGVYFLYFVGFWTSGAQATPAMRLFKLRVANASDGRRLAIGPATVRWLALGYIFTLISVIPALTGLSFLLLIWWIVLLVTTASHKMHQGLHDRWSKSVMVRPEAAGAGSGLVVACLIVVIIIALFFLTSIVGLILLGSQMSAILSTVGDSI